MWQLIISLYDFTESAIWFPGGYFGLYFSWFESEIVANATLDSEMFKQWLFCSFVFRIIYRLQAAYSISAFALLCFALLSRFAMDSHYYTYIAIYVLSLCDHLGCRDIKYT